MTFTQDKDHLDQHFLTDKEVIKKYIEACNLKYSDLVVEVGPGKGTLTRIIAPLVSHLTLIELDKTLSTYLDPIIKENNNIDIIYNNVLDTYIPTTNKIITSLPYSIIEPFIKKIIKCNFDELIMLIGSTFANNVIEKKITKLSIITNSHFITTKIFDVEPNSFDYPPRTMSSIIKIKKAQLNDLSFKYQIYNRLYFHQDKLIKNALYESIIDLKKITKKEAKKITSKLNIPEYILNDKLLTINNESLITLDSILDTINI